MTTATLRAPAISCDHCVNTIKRAVGRLPGVQSVQGDAAKKQVTVAYDPDAVSVERIAAVMAGEGYPIEC